MFLPIGKETSAASTRWVVEVYPFQNSIPQSKETDGSDNVTIIGGDSSDSKVVETVISYLKSIGAGSQFTKAKGIVHLAFQRSKNSPSSQCNLAFNGRLPPSVYVGAWVVVSSVYNNKGAMNVLTRFIGQIASVEPRFVVNEAGAFSQTTSVLVREWSSILETPVIFDINSLAAQSNATALASKLVKQEGGKEYEAILQNIINISDPFELANFILLLNAAMNKEDGIKRETDNGIVKEYPHIATKAQDIPSAVIKRVLAKSGAGTAVLEALGKIKGLTETSAKETGFQTGFVKTLTGLQNKSVYNDGNWNGLFSNIKLDAYKNILKNGYQSFQNRPKTAGVLQLLQSGASAWQMLNQFCDNAVNEVFTDIWHQDNGNGQIVSQPVIVIRDKPFLLKKLADQAAEDLKGWTIYDDIPRISIPTSVIHAFSVGNNIFNSPNYSRVEYRNLSNGRSMDALAAKYGITRLEPEMNRFGGNAQSYETFFLPTEKETVGTPEWLSRLRELFKMWHSYNYLMGDGVLSIRDTNIPISLGLNVQFQFGKYTLVGHVTAYSVDHMFDPQGTITTSTNITLSRVVQVLPNGNLDLISPDVWGSLPYIEPKPTTPSIQGAIAGIANKIKGIF